MKLHADVGDERHEIEITREGRRVFASVDGRTYELEASEPEPGVFLLKHEDRVYEATVNKSKGSTHVRIGRHEYDIRLVDPKRLRGASGAADHGDGVAEIKTAMPGKVVRILVKAGDTVEQGDGILVVEAMKMQNELRSPKSGVVKDLRAKEGATVGAGDILATVE